MNLVGSCFLHRFLSTRNSSFSAPVRSALFYLRSVRCYANSAPLDPGKEDPATDISTLRAPKSIHYASCAVIGSALNKRRINSLSDRILKLYKTNGTVGYSERVFASASEKAASGGGKNGNGTSDEPKLTLTQKFKKMWKQYWYVLLPVHAATSCMWFGLFYAVSVSGLDVISLLEYLHLPDRLLNHIRNAPQAGHVVVAIALYKIITPLRYMSTLGVTYFAIKSLSRLGYIKPMPSGKQLKAMIDKERVKFGQRRRRWRQERRFLMFKKRPHPSSNGHHHHPKRPNHD